VVASVVDPPFSPTTKPVPDIDFPAGFVYRLYLSINYRYIRYNRLSYQKHEDHRLMILLNDCQLFIRILFIPTPSHIVSVIKPITYASFLI